ncbi:MAG: hypothetical protein K2X82_07695 [Gemmataceae bacterium]|nr:hypothetical protein [Gemmataceae bacterium]
MRTTAFLVLAVLAAGCSRGGRVEDFTPPADNARKALDAALAHWRAGNPPGTVTGAVPAVEVLDGKWQGGQKLTAYEVVREEPGEATGPRTFVVRLTTGTGPPQEVKYLVVGIDPVWVYRDEDYQKLSGAGK